LIEAKIKGKMSYQKSYILELLGYFVVTGIDFAAIYFLFESFPAVKGWSLWEIVYLYGLGSSALAIAQLSGEVLEDMSLIIRNGEFDQVLIKPISPLLFLMPQSFRLDRFARLAQGVLASGFSFYYLNIIFSWTNVALFLCSFFSLIIIFISLFLANAATSFWTIQSSEVFNAFTYGGVEMSKFPLTIYKRWMQVLFLFFIPIGFVIFFPTSILFEKENLLNFPKFSAFLSPFIAIAFFGVIWVYWRVGIRHYQSTGS
jgi:ABC-2 type transport system permease protein